MKNILAYTAGYLDGDGCFFIGKNRNPVKYRSAIIVNSTNKNIVRFFRSKFGGQVGIDRINPKFKNYNPINSWYIQGQNALHFCQNVLPLLKEKTEDAKTFIEFFNEKSKNIKDEYIEKIKRDRNSNNLVTKEKIEFLNKIKKNGVPSEQDFAYLAGFIDAECNFTISRYRPKNKPNTTYKIILQCNNTKTPVISYLLSTFGGFCYFMPRKHKNPKHKDQVSWRITAKSLSLILPNLLPFLQYKRPICEQLVEFYATTLKNGGDRQKQEFKDSYQGVLSKRENIVSKIHLLNSKAIKTI